MKQRTLWLVLAALLILAVAGIFYSQQIRQVEHVSEAIHDVRVGAVLPMTGNLAFLGEGERRAMDMAVADLNPELMEDGYQLEVLYGDSQGTPRDGVSVANKFISVDGVNLLVGSTTGVANAMVPVVESAEGLLFAMTIAPFITERSPRVFRVWPSNELERKKQAEFVKEQGWSRLGIIHVEADYGLEAKRALLSHLGHGIEVVFDEAYPAGATDFRNLLVGLRGARVEVLVLAGYPPEFISLVRQLREIPFEGQIVGDIGFTFQFVRDALGEGANGIVFTAPRYSFDRGGQRTGRFTSEYVAEFDQEPSWNEAYSYDLILVLTEAVRRCQCTDPAGIAAALKQIQGLQGVTGEISILPSGDAVTEIGLAVLRDGELLALGEQDAQ